MKSKIALSMKADGRKMEEKQLQKEQRRVKHKLRKSGILTGILLQERYVRMYVIQFCKWFYYLEIMMERVFKSSMQPTYVRD